MLFQFSGSELKVFKTSELYRIPSTGDTCHDTSKLEMWSVVPIGHTVVDIGISSDQLTLSITVERADSLFANMYDVRGFASKVRVKLLFI